MVDKYLPQNITSFNKICDLMFYVLPAEEISKDSSVLVTSKDIMKNGKPAVEGLYDARLGSTDFLWQCRTCMNKKGVCCGHFGSMELRYPVKSPMFREELLKWLKVICHNCGEPIRKIKMNIPANKRLSELSKNIKSIEQCEVCGYKCYQVIKDKKRPHIFMRQYTDQDGIHQEEFYNHKILEVLNKIRDDTVIMLGKPGICHPRNFILRTINVPPNTIRPDIKRIGGTRSSVSDTTSLLKTLVDINDKLPLIPPPDDQISENDKAKYANLDMTYHSMIKGGGGGEMGILTKNKPPVAIAERLPKKQGRFRKNLMGKRVEYMIRSVITGDSILKINELGISLHHARELEIPEIVTSRNRNRLLQYYNNGNKKYPGCKHVIKKSDGTYYNIDILLANNYQLTEGDTVMRDLMTGDYVCFNRQPSLTFTSIAGMRVVIMEKSDTLRVNPAICHYFNADFDGDEMTSIVPQNIQARNECMSISKASRWLISPQIHAPSIGAFQDAAIGLSELTRDGIMFDKWHMMQLFADVTDVNCEFSKQSIEGGLISNRQIVSRFLPAINLSDKQPTYYKQQFAEDGTIKYNLKDINVEIVRGELKSGILDKATTGHDQPGSIFHIIANEYGNEKAIDIIYNLQRLTHKFLIFYGFTTGIADINITEEASANVKLKLDKIISDSRRITQKLNSGKLIPPLGVKLKDFYEAEQLGVLSTGDEFARPVLSAINVNSNHMTRMVLLGAKGKLENFVAINSSIGKMTVNGRRFPPQAGWGRTLPYYLRYDTEPAANGFISMSYRSGVTSNVYPFIAAEARAGAIANALSTSITGYQNRISIKNLESILSDNLRKATKNMNIIQPLCYENGINPAKLEKVKFPTIMMSDKDFEEQYHTKITAINKKFQNTEVKKLLDEEFNKLLDDRNYFRKVFMTLERHNPKEYLFSTTKQMPINVYRIIEDVIYNYSDLADNSALDPVQTIKTVKELCSNLGYLYYNEIQQAVKRPLPEYIVVATKLIQILIRSYLCCSYLLKKKVNNSMLEIIIDKIKLTYKKSLVDPGVSIGIIAAQCVCEPMTQYMLNAKHRAGVSGGTKTDAIVRLQEILGAKSTESMKNPHMMIMVKPEYEHDKAAVQNIATHIEMMQFSRFISDIRIFYESYGKPVHPNFVKESADIKQFEKEHYGIKIPNDLTKWCIRFGLNKEEMILKGMKIETIVLAIKAVEQNRIFVMYTPENSDNIYIRCYLRSSQIKTTTNNFFKDIVFNEMLAIKEIVIRGIRGIMSTSVIEIPHQVINSEGKIETKKLFGIYANGSNLREILCNKFIDPYRTQSDSLEEMEQVFGIIAARNKIINEMLIAMESNRIHSAIFADEMCYSGMVTNIQKTGLQKRENANITLRISFQTVIQVIQDSAIHGLVDKISGISGPLILGTNPNIGTTYNQVVVNEEFLRENAKSISKVIDDL